MKQLKRFLGDYCIFIPPIIILLLVIKYSVDVPYWDQWQTPAFQLEKIIDGNFQFSDLLAQHNESRKFFPKILFITLINLNGWNTQIEMIITIIFALIILLNIKNLIKKTFQNVPNHIEIIALLFVSFLIFSPMQWETWFWGINLISFIPMLCISICLRIIYNDNYSYLKKIIICSILATISTFSFANGILCWIIVFPVFLFHFIFHKKNITKKESYIFITPLTLFILNIIIYYFDYHKPSGHPSFLVAFENPLQFIAYFTGITGNPIGGFNLVISQIIGGIFLALFFCLIFYIFLIYKKNYYKFVPWVALASYSLFSNTITSLGRVGFGVEQSMSSRYITYSVFFIIGAINLLILVLTESKKIKFFQYKLNTITVITYFFIGILSVVYLSVFSKSILTIKHTHYERLYGKSCLILMNLVEDKECLEKQIFPDANTVDRIANKIEKKGWFNFNIIQNQDETNFLQFENNKDEKYGFFEDLIKQENDIYIAKGWAILPHRKEKSDVVILAYKTPDKSYKPFALAKVDIIREDIAGNLKEANYLSSGWQIEFSKSDIFNVNGDKIPESLELTAWGFDTDTGKTFQLSNNHILP